MKVALVKETRAGELRSLLLPRDVSPLCNICDFLVESGVGSGLGITDEAYQQVGARIVDRQNAWGQSDLVLKLKRPNLEEITSMSDGASLAGLLHAEDAPELVRILLRKNITSYSFEYFKDASGNFPLMQATGEISGKQAVIYAAYHLQSHLQGSGQFLPSCSREAGARVAIIGFGNVGRAAAETAIALGAEVIILRWSKASEQTVTVKGVEIKSYHATTANIDQIIPGCDVVIGAIRISTFDTPLILAQEVVRKMKPGSIIVDVTAGYGSGYIETSDQVTTLSDPYHIVHGVKHIKVRELPLGVHRTAAGQISSIYGQYIGSMVKAMVSNSEDPISNNGIITKAGKIVNAQVLKHFKKMSHDE